MPLHQESLEKSSDLLRALDHPIRVDILKLIASNGPMRVNDIISELNLNQALTSQQLKILRDSSLVRFNKMKTEVYYTAETEKLAVIESGLKKYFL